MGVENEKSSFLKQFAEGLKNTIVKNEQIELLHKERMSVCQTCEHYNTSTSQCKICGCFMPIKTRSTTSKCPKGYW